jgi:hypothetical protein
MKKNLLLLSAFLLSAVGFSQSVDYIGALPTTLIEGTTFDIDFDYSTPTDGTFQAQLFKTDASGAIDYSQGTDIYHVGPAPASGTNILLTGLSIPGTLALSSTLPTGVVYKWFVKLAVGGTDYYGSNDIVATYTTASLGVKNQSQVDAKEMFVNNTTKSLVVNTANVKADSAKIYSIDGKNVATINNLKSTPNVDLSGLKTGTYVLKASDNKALKFAF